MEISSTVCKLGCCRAAAAVAAAGGAGPPPTCLSLARDDLVVGCFDVVCDVDLAALSVEFVADEADVLDVETAFAELDAAVDSALLSWCTIIST